MVAVGAGIGGWTSVVVGRLVPQHVVRGFVILTGLSLTAWYLVA